MTREPTENLPVIYRIDGRKIRSAGDFYREIGSAVNGPGGYFGRNLDALADCLRGGFGTPEHRPYEFEWQHSALSRRYLDDDSLRAADIVRCDPRRLQRRRGNAAPWVTPRPTFQSSWVPFFFLLEISMW